MCRLHFVILASQLELFIGDKGPELVPDMKESVMSWETFLLVPSSVLTVI